MKTKLPPILTTIFRSIKQEFQGSPIKTSLAAVALLSVSGLGIYSHRYISALLKITGEANILVLILSLLSLITSLIILWKQQQRQRINKTSEVKNELVEAEGFKWETTFQNKSILHVSNIPFCTTHNRKLTDFKDTYDCMEKDCNTSIKTSMLPLVYKVALSHIERHVKKKC